MTRINVKLWGGMEGEINAGGPACDEKSLQALFEKLSVLTKEDVLVLSGSVPASLPKDVYVDMMELVKTKGTRVAVDATGALLRNTISHGPLLVKPNHHELGELYGVVLKTKEEVLPYAKRLREEGAKNVLVSMAGEGAVLAAEDGSIWFGEAPQGTVVNTVGSGDSMLAGFIWKYEEAKSVEKAFKAGIASGSASAFSPELGTKDEVECLLSKVQIKRVE
jgi:1-phosphofructokinase